MGIYFKVAPGVRVRVTSRGVRTSIGPREARLQVGGGYRPGISTGAGPVTLYHAIGGPARRRRPATSPAASSPAASSKMAEAARISALLTEFRERHRHPVPAVAPPAAPPAPPVDAAAIRSRSRREAVRGVPFWRLSARRAARVSADERSAAEVEAAGAQAEAHRRDLQAALDRHWQRLLANEPDVVIPTLAEAFEDQGMPAAPLAVHGGEASVAVFVPGPEVVPDRLPGTTAAGNPSLRRMTKAEEAALYAVVVCGQMVAAVREALAVAPGLDSVRAAALRLGPSDGYGKRGVECLVAVTLSRSALAGVDWDHAESPAVVEQCGTHLNVNLTGRTRHLEPVDLAGEPELAALVGAVDAPVS